MGIWTYLKRLFNKRYFFEKLQEFILIIILYKNFPQVISTYCKKKRQREIKLIFRNNYLLYVKTKYIYWKRNGLKEISNIFTRDIYSKYGLSIKTGDTIIVLGAHVGTFTIYAADRVTQKGKVFAYEPAPYNYLMLKRNILVNHLTQVRIFNLALSSKSGKTKLFLSDCYYEHSLKNRTDKYISVETVTLNRVFQKNKISICDLLKVDIEGAEWEVLNNFSLANLGKIKQIAMEYHNNNNNISSQSILNVKKILTQNGFIVYIVPNRYISSSGYLYALRKVRC